MKLNIAYSTDENYVRHLGVSMVSLLENNKEFEEISIYVIEKELSEKSRQELVDIANGYRRNLEFISFEHIASDLVVDNSFSIMSYGRLFLSRIKGIEKIIYLDCDSVVTGSLKSVWEEDISQYYIAAVQDTVNIFYLTSIGLNKKDRYINAGFLVANLKKWREDNLEKEYNDFINKFQGSVPHHDQGTLNAICKGKILILHPKYNLQCPMFHFTSKQIKELDNIEYYYDQDKIDEAKIDPIFIHYTNGYFNRPWNKDCSHPMVSIYRHYLAISPWKDCLMSSKLNRNATIMKLIYTYMPFFIYKTISRLISINKSRKLMQKFR